MLWDLDGTLVDSEPAHDLAFDSAAADLGLSLPDTFHDALLGASGTEVHAALVASTGATIDYPAWRDLKWHHYTRHADIIRRRDAVADVFVILAGRGVAMAVVSNSTREEVAFNLDKTGLSPYVSTIICRDDVSRGKPDPEGYLAAAGRLGIAAADCIVLEDSTTGVQAGRRAGMVCVFHPQRSVQS